MSTLTEHLTKVGNDPTADDYQTDYALQLSPGDSITHNRFVVPDEGVLRFDLHVPDTASNPRLPNSSIRTFIKASDSNDWQPLTPIFTYKAQNPAERGENAVGYYDFVNGQYIDPYTRQIGYGQEGFETFHLDIPDELRGKSAQLRFDLGSSSSPVYLDNVFFKSQHLMLGNPSDAQTDVDQADNYLIEKPQYTVSYSDQLRAPNWVSWKLDRSWLGDVKREDLRLTNRPFNYPPDSQFIPGSNRPEAWNSDLALPNSPFEVRVEGADLNNAVSSGRIQRGHLVPFADRQRTQKDALATFITTNMIPQARENNINNTAWQKFELYLQRTIAIKEKHEIHIIAGAYYTPGSNRKLFNQVAQDTEGNWVQAPNTEQFSPPRLSTPTKSEAGRLNQTRKALLNQKEIPVPDFTWKIATVLEPGQNLSDIDANTQVIALITPNRQPPVGNSGSVQLPGGQTRTVADWRHWPNWRVNVDYLEDITGYDFFSDLPQEIQQAIQADDSSELTLPLRSNPSS